MATRYTSARPGRVAAPAARMRAPRSPKSPVQSLPPDTRLQFEERPGYLYVEVNGPRDNFDISVAYWNVIAGEVRRRGTRALMVVEHLGPYEGERDMAAMVDALIALGFDQLKVAFVIERIELLGLFEHGEILALERGANGRVFANPSLAERWLRHGGA